MPIEHYHSAAISHPNHYNHCNITKDELLIYEETNPGNRKTVEYFKVARVILRLIGLAANLALLGISIYGLKCKVLYPKRYVFILSKTVADALSCFVIAFILGLRQTVVVSDLILGISIVIITISVYSACVCNCALALITYLAISKPFYYKTTATVKKCLLVIASVWLFASIIGTLTTLGGVATFKPKQMDYCKFVCMQTLKLLGAIIIWIIYILSPAIYICVLVHILRSTSSSSENNKEIRDLWKLGLHILAFAVLFLPSCIDQIIAVEYLQVWLTADSNKCYKIEHWRKFFNIRLIYEIAQVARSLRTIIDPTLVCLIDTNARQILLTCFRCQCFKKLPNTHSQISLSNLASRYSVVSGRNNDNRQTKKTKTTTEDMNGHPRGEKNMEKMSQKARNQVETSYGSTNMAYSSSVDFDPKDTDIDKEESSE